MMTRRKRTIGVILAAAWGVLLIPLAVYALDLATPLDDALSVLDQIAVKVLHTIQTPQDDAANLGDQVAITVLHTRVVLVSDIAAVSEQVTVTRTVASTSTTMSSSSNPSTYGSSITLTATMTAIGGNPGSGAGTVDFAEGTVVLCGAVPLSGNQATCITGPAAGSHALTASYSGTSIYAASSGGLIQQVNPAPLVVTANDATKIYGDADPAFSVSYNGFVNGQTSTVLGGALMIHGPPANSGVGVYTGQIVASGLTSTNYAISYVSGTLTITRAPLTVSANDASKVYGAANPTFTVGYTGFTNGDTAGSLGGTLSFSAPPANSAVGTYAGEIVPSGLASTNYSISYVNGTLTVTPAPLTITANSVTRYYGQANPPFGFTASGLVNGDGVGSLGAATYATLATQTSTVGDYAFTVSGLSNANYAISYLGGTLHILQAPTVTTLSSAPNPALVNAPVTLTATVTSGAPGGLNPSGTGTVAFRLGGTTFASVALDVTGHAAVTVSTLPVGHDALTAVYSGDINYAGSASSAIVEVVKANTIVFSSNRNGNFEIYAMDANGARQTRLTTNPAVDTMPAFSSDGTRIAFVSTRTGLPQIWMMNADGTNLKQLTADPGVDGTPAWSPDGTKVAYTSSRSGSLQLWTVDTGGPYPATTRRQLTPNTFAVVDTTPAWSPNGMQIAFTSTHSGLPQIWVINADGTSPTRLITDNAIDASPAWSPDGARIAFSGTRQGLPAIYVMDANGGNLRRVTTNRFSIDATPSWSPDGSALAFTSTLGGIIEIYEVGADGTGQLRITSGPAVNALPQWCCAQAP